MAGWNDNSHPKVVVNLGFKDLAFPLPAMVVQSTGQTVKPSYREQGPATIPGGEVIKIYHTNNGGNKYRIKIIK